MYTLITNIYSSTSFHSFSFALSAWNYTVWAFCQTRWAFLAKLSLYCVVVIPTFFSSYNFHQCSHQLVVVLVWSRKRIMNNNNGIEEGGEDKKNLVNFFFLMMIIILCSQQSSSIMSSCADFSIVIVVVIIDNCFWSVSNRSTQPTSAHTTQLESGGLRSQGF